MTRLIQCVKLNKEAEGLAQPPFPSDVGKKIYAQVSKEAWQMWVDHQTMLINENRLSMLDPKARAFLMTEMDKFLFGPGSEKPPGYTEAQKASSA